MKLFVSIMPVVLILLIIQSASASSGDLLWQQTLGGPVGEEWGYSLDSIQDSGLLVTGVAYSEDANITGAHGNGDLWVVRLDSSGKPLWNRAFGGNESDYGLSVKTTSDGGSVIVGTTGSTNGDIAGYHGNGDLWVLRLSAAGDPLWQKVYGGNRTDEGGDILQTSDGGYLVTGYTMSDDGDAIGHHGGGDLWMLHLDQNGNILWQKTIGGSKRDSGSSIIRTSDGGYAMTGNTYSSDGDVTGNHGSSDLWVVKTDPQGNLVWQKTFGGSKLDWGHSLIELPGGDLLVAGVTASSDGDVTLNHGAGDIWVLRLTGAGQKVWERTYGGTFSDNVWNVAVSPIGGAYLVGETFSVDGDFTGNHGDADLWVSEIDGNGTLLWYRMLGGKNYESGSWLKVLPDGNLTICGTTRSSDGDVVESRGEGDLWVVKVDAKGTVLLSTPALSNETSPTTTTAPVATLLPEPVHTTINGNVTPAVITNNTPAEPNTTLSPETNASATPVPTLVTIPINTTPDQNTTAGNSTSVSAPMLTPVPGQNLTPTDPDKDGQYEDLNGNGKADLQDATVFFSSYDWIQAHYPPVIFDFNHNGSLDFGDINALFEEVSG